jgi:hypothetical protein
MATNQSSTRKTVREAAAQGPCYKVMVALRGIEKAAASGDDRVSKHAAMRAAAKEGRNRVVAWLREQNVEGQYKRVSEPTAFGTFTVECSATVVRKLKRAPGVQSVVRVSDVPLEIVGRKR